MTKSMRGLVPRTRDGYTALEEDLMNTADATWLDEAIRLGRKGMQDGDGGPFGAVIVLDDTVVGRGWNRVLASHDPTAHAEVAAIRDACARLGRFHLDGAVLYASCEPCPMCLAAIYWARITRVVHAGTRQDAADAGFADADIYDELARPAARRRLPCEHVPRPDAPRLFAEWKAKADRIRY